MKRRLLRVVVLASLGALLLTSFDAEAQQRRRRRPRAEVIAWSANASIVIFAEPTKGRRPAPGERRRPGRVLVARRVPSGEVITRTPIFPGPCANRIEERIAIAHACALAQIRPRLPSSQRVLQFHVAATSRGRILSVTLRADGSIVEHELPRLGLVLRGRTEEGYNDQAFAILEVVPINREGEGRILDRRPIRLRARRRWTLLQAGEDQYILIGRGVLRRIRRRGRARDRVTPRPDGAGRPPTKG